MPVHRPNGAFTVARKRISDEPCGTNRGDAGKLQRQRPASSGAPGLLAPTVAYIGGPAEIAYFAQSAVVYEKLLGRITPILPRMSATLIEPRIERLLNKYEVELPELFHGECELRDCLATRSLPAELKRDFEQAREWVEDAMARISHSLKKLDPTLTEAAGRAGNKMRYQVGRLEKRAAPGRITPHRDFVATRGANRERAIPRQGSSRARDRSHLFLCQPWSRAD